MKIEGLMAESGHAKTLAVMVGNSPLSATLYKMSLQIAHDLIAMAGQTAMLSARSIPDWEAKRDEMVKASGGFLFSPTDRQEVDDAIDWSIQCGLSLRGVVTTLGDMISSGSPLFCGGPFGEADFDVWRQKAGAYAEQKINTVNDWTESPDIEGTWAVFVTVGDTVAASETFTNRVQAVKVESRTIRDILTPDCVAKLNALQKSLTDLAGHAVSLAQKLADVRAACPDVDGLGEFTPVLDVLVSNICWDIGSTRTACEAFLSSVIGTPPEITVQAASEAVN